MYLVEQDSAVDKNHYLLFSSLNEIKFLNRFLIILVLWVFMSSGEFEINQGMGVSTTIPESTIGICKANKIKLIPNQEKITIKIH